MPSRKQTSYSFDVECERLVRANSEEVTDVYFREYHVPRDEQWTFANRLSAALRQSTHVKSLFLQLDVLKGDLASLVEYLSDPATGLKKVRIYIPHCGHLSTSTGATKIIPAVANNVSIKDISISLSWTKVKSMADLSLLLHPSHAEVVSMSCASEIALDFTDLGRITSAFASNRALKRLSLSLGGKDASAQHLAEKLALDLRGHPRLERFEIGMFGNNKFSAKVGASIGLLINSTPTLQTIGLDNGRWNCTNFGPVADSVQKFSWVNHIILTRSTFDETSTSLLRSIFYTPSREFNLELSQHFFTYAPADQSLICQLVESAPALNALDIHALNASQCVSLKIHAALKSPTSAVQEVQFGYLDYDNGITKNFLPHIPKCPLKRIGFTLWDHFAEQKALVIKAFSQNESIIDTSNVVASFFDDEDRQKLEKIAMRNKKLTQMITSQPCDDLPVSLWPHMFKVAQSYRGGLTRSFAGVLALVNNAGLPSRERTEEA